MVVCGATDLAVDVGDEVGDPFDYFCERDGAEVFLGSFFVDHSASFVL